VTGRSYGIAALNEGKACVYTLIPKNSTLPAKGKHIFYTKYWGQEIANIKVNETFTSAQKEHIANGKEIGAYELKIKAKNLPGKSPISVTLELDENGLLHVQAEELKGRTKVEAKIKTLEAS
jgi:molecular chaperone DnaK (HSP70)